jgi:molecular chaperone HtpG
MKEGQDKIYYITADSFAAAKNSPLLEYFRKKGVEVLLLSDFIDNWLVSNLFDYKGKQLQSISRGALDLDKLADEQEKEELKKAGDEFKSLTERIKTVLGEKVKEVRVSNRLINSPSCLVADEHDIDPNLRRILKAAGRALPGGKPIFEVNPQHPILLRMQNEQDETRFHNWIQVLYDQAVLTEGETLEDPAEFVNRLNELLVSLAEGR